VQRSGMTFSSGKYHMMKVIDSVLRTMSWQVCSYKRNKRFDCWSTNMQLQGDADTQKNKDYSHTRVTTPTFVHLSLCYISDSVCNGYAYRKRDTARSKLLTC
jgi:hypothetical protein